MNQAPRYEFFRTVTIAPETLGGRAGIERVTGEKRIKRALYYLTESGRELPAATTPIAEHHSRITDH